MHEHVTLLRPDAPRAGAGGISGSLPRDLLEQVRRRVALLAILILCAFALDPLLYAGAWLTATLTHHPQPGAFYARLPFQWVSLGAAAASAALWWVARNRAVSTAALHTLGLAYEVAICFVIAIETTWIYYLDHGILPNLTWVPAVVILFPLIMPGPPPRMLAAAIAAGAMAPLALALLDLTGRVVATGDAYAGAIVSSAVAVAFASVGARVVYGLGREITSARELGSYRLEERLGSGGMGEVWRAKHRLLARPAAIKLIHTALLRDGHQGALPRFEREAQVIARLRSPHTVTLFDFGVADDGAFYYVMELLDGLDADTLVKRFGPVPPPRAIALLRQVCHSLSEANACGLVHRDIKPANIFLCRYGEDCDFVKVLDFGLVKALGDAVAADPGLTRENMVHGTPGFIAPEQALGRADLDGRADVYATGCVAFWLLTGQLVFTADTAMGLLLHHAHTPAEAPSTRTELPIPAALDRLVLACLAKDPAERPQSARELGQRLGEIEGADAWSAERAREWWGRHQPVGA